MREFDHEHVWVYLEVTDWSSQKHYRGRVRRADYEAILEGQFTKPFLTVDHTFWTKDDGFVLAGRGENQRHRFSGTFHFPAKFITTIGVLRDCTDLFLTTMTDESAASAWEQGLLPGDTATDAVASDTPETAPETRTRGRKKSV
jgi:hypothetical protein